MEQATEEHINIPYFNELEYKEILRERRKHDEAQALRNAREKERKRLESVFNAALAEKDAAIAEKDAAIAAAKKEKDTTVKALNTIIADLTAQLAEKQ
ncbi:MAG: hypothetical protein FWG68_11210 [Defluviitaleaceae bacterium]|nr:hypothetical protein [Defluviitaleaceae bacterium]